MTARRELKRVLDEMEPRLAEAFVEATKTVKDGASMKAISEAISIGDLARAVRLAGTVNLAETFKGVGIAPGKPVIQDILLDTFREGGTAGMRQMPLAAGVRASLDLTNPEAVRYLQEHLPTLIQGVGEETQRAVRAAVLRGFDEGRPPIQIAREIRESIGLTEKQAEAVGNFRRQLETGELGGGTRPWATRTAEGEYVPGRRLSATEQAQARAIMQSEAKPDPAKVNALVERYQESLINRRAQDIARTEVHRAFTEGQDELWRQATEQELLPKTTRRIWIVTGDERLRPDHAAMPELNEGGVLLGQPFVRPGGGTVTGPGQSGDPAFDINCRCTTALEFDE